MSDNYQHELAHALKSEQRQRDTLGAENARLQAACEAALEYALQWPIGIDDEPQEWEGGARDVMIQELRAALRKARGEGQP